MAREGAGPDMGQFGGMMPNLGGDEQMLMLAGPYAQQFITGSILVFKNTLDWMTGDTDLLAVSAKILADPNPRLRDKLKITPDESEEQDQEADGGPEGGSQEPAGQRRGLPHPRHPLLFGLYGPPAVAHALASRANVSLA